MCDDIISASGLSVTKIPWWQKVFWCWTEGLVAICLVNGGASASKALQALSIIFGLPYTFLLCFMVPSLYRSLKHIVGDQDIKESYRFNTQIFDFLEGFAPRSESPCARGKHISALLTGLVAPFVSVKKGLEFVNPENKMGALMYALFAQLMFVVWFVLHVCEVAGPGLHSIAWLAYTFMVFVIALVRTDVRRKEKIWGNPLEDFFISLAAYPFALSQIQMHAETAGDKKQLYFQQIDELIIAMSDAAVGDGDVALKEVQTSTA
jgi:hypothetical protein